MTIDDNYIAGNIAGSDNLAIFGIYDIVAGTKANLFMATNLESALRYLKDTLVGKDTFVTRNPQDFMLFSFEDDCKNPDVVLQDYVVLHGVLDKLISFDIKDSHETGELQSKVS